MLSLLLSLASSDAQACSPAPSEEVVSFPEWGSRGVALNSRILLQVGGDRLGDPADLGLEVLDAKGQSIEGELEVSFSAAAWPYFVNLSFIPAQALPPNSEIRATATGVREEDGLDPASVLFVTGSEPAVAGLPPQIALQSWAFFAQDECWGDRDEVELSIRGDEGSGQAVYALAVDEEGQLTDEVLGLWIADGPLVGQLSLEVEDRCIAVLIEQHDGVQGEPLLLCEDEVWDDQEFVCGTGGGFFGGGCSTGGGAPAGLFAGLIGLLGLMRRRRS